VSTGCPLNGHGLGHVSNFYVLDLENFLLLSDINLSSVKVNERMGARVSSQSSKGDITCQHIDYMAMFC